MLEGGQGAHGAPTPGPHLTACSRVRRWVQRGQLLQAGCELLQALWQQHGVSSAPARLRERHAPEPALQRLSCQGKGGHKAARWQSTDTRFTSYPIKSCRREKAAPAIPQPRGSQPSSPPGGRAARRSSLTQLLPTGTASSRSTGNSVPHTTTSATDSASCSTKERSCAPRRPRPHAASPTNARERPPHPGQVRRASPGQAPLDVAQRSSQRRRRLRARPAVHQAGVQGRQSGGLRADGGSRPGRTAATAPPAARPPPAARWPPTPAIARSGRWAARRAAGRNTCGTEGRRQGAAGRGGRADGRTDGPALTDRWRWGRRAPRRSPAAGRGTTGGTAGTAAALRDGELVRGRRPRRPSGPGEASPPPAPSAARRKASPPGSAQQSSTGAAAHRAAATTFSAAGLPGATRSCMATR